MHCPYRSFFEHPKWKEKLINGGDALAASTGESLRHSVLVENKKTIFIMSHSSFKKADIINESLTTQTNSIQQYGGWRENNGNNVHLHRPLLCV